MVEKERIRIENKNKELQKSIDKEVNIEIKDVIEQSLQSISK